MQSPYMFEFSCKDSWFNPKACFIVWLVTTDYQHAKGVRHLSPAVVGVAAPLLYTGQSGYSRQRVHGTIFYKWGVTYNQKGGKELFLWGEFISKKPFYLKWFHVYMLLMHVLFRSKEFKVWPELLGLVLTKNNFCSTSAQC